MDALFIAGIIFALLNIFKFKMADKMSAKSCFIIITYVLVQLIEVHVIF